MDKEVFPLTPRCSRYVAVTLVRRGDLCLFIHQDKPGGAYPGTLHLPGGGIDDGEAPDAAAAREVLEETGLTATDVRLVDTDWDVTLYKGEPTMLVYLRFTAVSLHGEAVPGSDAKEVLWVPVAELDQHPHNEPSLRMLRGLGLI